VPRNKPYTGKAIYIHSIEIYGKNRKKNAEVGSKKSAPPCSSEIHKVLLKNS